MDRISTICGLSEVLDKKVPKRNRKGSAMMLYLKDDEFTGDYFV